MENNNNNSSVNTKSIAADAQVLYNAFTNPEALQVWLAPGNMKGKVHQFNGRVGGGYTMSLYYPAGEQSSKGKTAEKEDRFTARFTELKPFTKIVQCIVFDTADPAYAGEMIMETTFETVPGGTNVTIRFAHIPAGINPADNETGTKESLEKLADYVKNNPGLK